MFWFITELHTLPRIASHSLSRTKHPQWRIPIPLSILKRLIYKQILLCVEATWSTWVHIYIISADLKSFNCVLESRRTHVIILLVGIAASVGMDSAVVETGSSFVELLGLVQTLTC